MSEWVKNVRELVEMAQTTSDRINKMPVEMRCEFLFFRGRFVMEEANELRLAQTPEEVVDALVDICVVAIGTLVAFGVDADEAWRRVHAANMGKLPGVNLRRPNPFSLPDLVKPEGWIPPDHTGNVGLLSSLFKEAR
jgi:predicted HAD superfamily Cof-like phosphohydrolase